MLQGLEFAPDLVQLILHGIGRGLEQDGGFHVFDRIGEAPGLHHDGVAIVDPFVWVTWLLGGLLICLILVFVLRGRRRRMKVTVQ